MQKKLKIGIIALAAILIVSAVVAQGFHLIWNQIPFEPSNYSWEEPWEVHEMVDFVDAKLTITGCSYEGQDHDLELIITNVANTPDYYLTSFSYLAKWYVDEANQEPIMAGAYTGDPLAVDSFVTYVDTWVPTIIGAGFVKMNIIDIVWAQSEPITWTTEWIDNINGPTWDITDFAVTGATKTYMDGSVAFTITLTSSGPYDTCFKVEIIKDATVIQLVGEETITFNIQEPQSFEYNFDGVTESGAYTMRLTLYKPPP